jgi:hypothetical protein
VPEISNTSEPSQLHDSHFYQLSPRGSQNDERSHAGSTLQAFVKRVHVISGPPFCGTTNTSSKFGKAADLLSTRQHQLCIQPSGDTKAWCS